MIKKQQSALLFIFITLLIDIIGLGIIIPVLPRLITNLTGEGLSAASKYGGWLMFAYAVMQFLFSPILGNLSDQYGRRPILLFSLLGFGIDYLFLAFAPTILWLFVGRLVAGITGASITTASAYIADVSEPEKRAQNFGLIGAAFGVGFIIGPVLGGLLSSYGIRVPFFVAATLCFINALYGFFILPESLSLENRRLFEWKKANPLGTFLHLKRYPKIFGLIGVLALVYVSSHALQSVWAYFGIYQFHWTEAQIGYSLGFVGVMVAIVQGGLIRVILPKIGQEKSLYIGLLISSITYALFAFASTTWMMYAIMVPCALGGIAGPAIQGIISNQIPANEQGELQGGLTSLMSITSIVGPVLMTNAFSLFTSKNAPVIFPGISFFMGAVLLLIACFWAYATLKKYRV